ncbi:MAG: hypothetical protein ACXVEF_38265 [Polyangiales bacterium]
MRRVPILVACVIGAVFAACSGDRADSPVDSADAMVDSEPVLDVEHETREVMLDTEIAEAEAATDTRDAEPADATPVAPADFHVPGTQMGDVSSLLSSSVCAACHAGETLPTGPYETWKGSLMAWSGKDPLFFAQLATATQDVPTVGYYCERCHVPMAIVSTHAASGKESALDDSDRDGVTCAFCHAMVDPKYVAGKSPAVDAPILAALKDVPTTYGNAQFVIDPAGSRRGPYDFSTSMHPHATIKSPFVEASELCGTCHEVGNPATMKAVDGTWTYDPAGTPAADPDPHAQFPLERTYSEWKLSSFAAGGVSMKGRFGGEGADVVSTCQDCHMPIAKGRACAFGSEHDDLPRHDFAGASAWVLRAIAADGVTNDALAIGATAAEAMVRKAATLELTRTGSTLSVKVINESGHKLPTGHIEGRRVFLSVQALDGTDAILKEWGRWDPETGDLDEASTTVFEMTIGLSAKAAAITGLPAGRTTHMSLADTIVKDNRIPPRGFAHAAFEAAGAPVVGATYADGEHWATVDFTLPSGTKKAKVTLWYQTVTRHYVEALRDGNKTDDWGKRLYAAWEKTAKGAPIAMASADLTLP